MVDTHSLLYRARIPSRTLKRLPKIDYSIKNKQTNEFLARPSACDWIKFLERCRKRASRPALAHGYKSNLQSSTRSTPSIAKTHEHVDDIFQTGPPKYPNPSPLFHYFVINSSRNVIPQKSLDKMLKFTTFRYLVMAISTIYAMKDANES